MKYLVMSDIHGVYKYAMEIDNIVKRENPNEIILLGDIYYHGLNPDLNQESMKVYYLLDKYKDIIRSTIGNCDRDTDILMSNFEFQNYLNITIHGKKFFFTHGHLYDIYSIPDNIDVFIFGHLHTHFIKKINNKLCINSGSLSLPRNNTFHSYLIIDDNKLIIKDIDNNIIDSVEYTTEV